MYLKADMGGDTKVEVNLVCSKAEGAELIKYIEEWMEHTIRSRQVQYETAMKIMEPTWEPCKGCG